jgi:multiple sugar transport system substrate-binding protein
MMMWQNGGRAFDQSGGLVIGKPSYLDLNAEALRFCAMLQLEEQVHPTEAAIETLPSNPFVAGRVAMQLSGTWLNNQIRGRSDFRWDMAPPPRRKQKATLVFGGSPVIHSGTEHPEAAWRLLKAMLGEEWQRAIAREARNLPGRKSVARDLQIPGIPPGVDLQVAFDVVSYARSQPMGPNVSEWLEQPIANLRDRVLLGSVSGDRIRAELQEMQQKYDEACGYCSVLR